MTFTDKDYVTFVYKEARKQAGFSIPRMVKSISNSKYSLCPECDQEFATTDLFGYIEHYKAEHRVDVEIRRLIRENTQRLSEET